MIHPAGVNYEGVKVAIIGASGFIGAHLVRRLLRAGAKVEAVSRVERDDAGGVRWWRARTTDAAETERTLDAIQPEVVFHLASHVSGARSVDLVAPTLEANLLSTVNVLTWAAQRGCERVVLAGSMEEPASSGSEATPSSPYAAAKQAAGAYGRMFHALHGVPVANLRVFMTYGPGQRDDTKLVPYVTQCLLRGEEPQVSSGRRVVDWIYVEDVAEAFAVAGANPGLEGETVDVGTGRGTSIGRVVEMLQELIGAGRKASLGAVPDRPMETERVADVERSSALLRGWRPRTTLETGLERTVEWYRRRPTRPRDADASVQPDMLGPAIT
jgi:UDP-glucose 4-epimerase